MQPPHPRRLIVSHARNEAYVPMTRSVLANMGYVILTEAEWGASPEFATREPELRLVEAQRLDALPRPGASSGDVPVVVIAGRRGVPRDDPRILGAVHRPAGLHELYRLIQQALEDRPRTAPRLPTHLEARLRHGRREWQGAVLSLSENGCLLRSTRPPPLGAQLEIRFEIPPVGTTVETRADCAYQLRSDAGLVFQSTPPDTRRAIQRFVEAGLGRVV